MTAGKSASPRVPDSQIYTSEIFMHLDSERCPDGVYVSVCTSAPRTPFRQTHRQTHRHTDTQTHRQTDGRIKHIVGLPS